MAAPHRLTPLEAQTARDHGGQLVAARFCLKTARIVSWLTPNSAASERRLLVAARARIEDSCSKVSL